MSNGAGYWRYQAAGCRLLINPKQGGKFELLVNDEVVGVYNSAQAAADDVFTCSTGAHEWDRQGTVNQPTNIHEWEHVKMSLLDTSHARKSRTKLTILKPRI